MARQLMEEMGWEEQSQLLVQRETYSRCHTRSVRGGVGGARVGRQKWTNLLIAVISILVIIIYCHEKERKDILIMLLYNLLAMKTCVYVLLNIVFHNTLFHDSTKKHMVYSAMTAIGCSLTAHTQKYITSYCNTCTGAWLRMSMSLITKILSASTNRYK